MTQQKFDKLAESLTVADVRLCDDGSVDTCVEIKGKQIWYMDTSDYRDESGAFTDVGWMEFAEMALDDYLEDLAATIK